MADLPPNPDYIVATPVTVECVQRVAASYQIPLAALAAIMAQEAGQVGKASRNRNGTYDYGPMQVNTIWLKHLRPYGITKKELMWNGCLNVYAAGAIFYHHYRNTNADVWKAIGLYHSGTKKYQRRYINSVARKIRSTATLAKIVSRANRYLRQLTAFTVARR